MDYIARDIDGALQKWAESRSRKPLILRGARQVGKTATVEHFGLAREGCVTINFERNPDIASKFEKNLDPVRILRELELSVNQRIVPGKTLLFLDEIQACPKALTSLRYFYEQLPDLHLIAAGSLLEFAMGKVSFPVGRVDYRTMYPLNFLEFLRATGRDVSSEFVPRFEPEKPDLEPPPPESMAASEKISEALREYLIVGGMPEAVRTFVETQSFLSVSKVQDNLIQSFLDDAPKYASGELQIRNLSKVLSRLFHWVGKQVKYTSLSDGDDSKRTKRSLHLLEKANLCHRIPSANPGGMPLHAESSSKVFKCLFLDVGLGRKLSGASSEEIINTKDVLGAYEGRLAEQFVGQQLLSSSGQASEGGRLYCWIRNARGSSAEVDYLIVRNEKIYPVEVKSGPSGKLRSLHLLMEKYPNVKTGLCLQNLSIEKMGRDKNIVFLPLYCIL